MRLGTPAVLHPCHSWWLFVFTVLEGGNPRAFSRVMTKANTYLNRYFGMELVPLIPRDLDEQGDEALSKKKQKKRANNNSNDGEESSSEDEAAARATAAAAKKKKKKAPTARGFTLRTTLPAELVAKAIVPMHERQANDPNHAERFAEDAASELGSAGVLRDELKEWKMGRDEIIDWRTGSDQRTLMGLLNVVLALIMVNERVLTDEQLMKHLKRLDLHLGTVLPLTPSALNPDKQTLNTFLATLIRQQYLEKTKVTAAPAATGAGAGAGAAAGIGAGAGKGTQRARATQSTRAGGADTAAEEGGASGSADEEWRWGPRAYVEIGEQGIAAFIKDFYGSLAAGGDDLEQGNGRPVKDQRTLEKEIIKGTTGGNKNTKLQDARDEGEGADD